MLWVNDSELCGLTDDDAKRWFLIWDKREWSLVYHRADSAFMWVIMPALLARA